MSTGHMAYHAMGTEAFLRTHADDLVARTAAAVSLEHLGARPWLPDANGDYRLGDGYETALCFSSPHKEIVKVARRAQEQSQIDGNRVLRPFMPDTISGESPNGFWWPGDGEGLWRVAALPSLQYISGPAYLLSSGKPVMDFIDTAAVRRQAVAFTDAVLELTRIPRDQLDQLRPDNPGNIPLFRCNPAASPDASGRPPPTGSAVRRPALEERGQTGLRACTMRRDGRVE